MMLTGDYMEKTNPVVIADAGPVIHLDELDCLDILSEFGNCLLLTDDTAARLAAQSLNIAAHGTLGLLIRAIRRQCRSKPEVLTLLRDIPVRSTLHIRPDLLAEVIANVEANAK